MGKINVLPFAVANLIAAGEVVDRPASVIKELMENAIDAHATRVSVEIQNGGVTLMRVTDNGCGMTADDLPVAIRRHATSKIRTAEDLDGISTLGFRGEALAAIAAVSDLRILSKTKDSPLGACLEARAGEIVGVTEQGCPDGTSVIVENLFACVPARRKFLKKDVTESMAVAANVEKVALSHPEIAFRLIIDGSMKIDTAGDGSLENVIYALYGKDFSTRLISVESDNEGIVVKGMIGRTDNFKANRNYENFFINGRYVKSKTMAAALEQAYTSYMPPEKFPVCALFLTLNPSRVDVNVHPAKLEVKFSNEKPIFEAVYYTVRTALENNVTRPAMMLDVSNKAKRNDNFFGAVSKSEVPIAERGQSVHARQLSYDTAGKMQPQPQDRMTAEEYRNLGKTDSKIPTVEKSASNGASVAYETVKNVPLVPKDHSTEAREFSKPAEPEKTEKKPENTDFCKDIPQNQPQNATELPRQSTEEKTYVVPEYRMLGEVFHSYVIVEVGEKMLLIDKHAAHERILFEQLKANLKTQIPCSQMLMIPIEVMLTGAEVEALREFVGELEKIGFSVQFGKNTVSVLATPEGVETAAVPDMLQAMSGRILNATGSVQLTRDIIFEKALYQAACKAAVKAGREYADGHIKWIVDQLMKIPDITFCPHGRPVALELSHGNLDKQFDRLGF